MSRREDIDNAVWTDPDFADLSADAKLLYLWSFTNPACGMAGLYKASHGLACFQTGLTPKRAERSVGELTAARFLYWEDGVIWVRSRVKHLWNRHERIATSVFNDVQKIPVGHPLRRAFLMEYAGDEDFGERLAPLVDELSLKRESNETHKRVG